MARHPAQPRRVAIGHDPGHGMAAALPGPRNWGTEVGTGASRPTLPRATSTISDVVVATTLVSEARSYNVLSGSTGGLPGDQVRWPYPFANSTVSRRPTTSAAPGYAPSRIPRSTSGSNVPPANRTAGGPTPGPRPGATAAPICRTRHQPSTTHP